MVSTLETGRFKSSVAHGQIGIAKSSSILFTVCFSEKMLSAGRRNLVKLEAPTFTRSRYTRRYNMQDEDRLKFFNWNLACLILTAIPLAYMQFVNYHTSDDTRLIMRTLDPMREAPVTYSSPSLFRL